MKPSYVKKRIEKTIITKKNLGACTRWRKGKKRLKKSKGIFDVTDHMF